MPTPGGAVFLFGWPRRIAVKNHMGKAETLRNIWIFLAVHFRSEHLIRPRINFEIAVECLIDHQRLAGFCMRGDGEDLLQLVLEV